MDWSLHSWIQGLNGGFLRLNLTILLFLAAYLAVWQVRCWVRFRLAGSDASLQPGPTHRAILSLLWLLAYAGAAIATKWMEVTPNPFDRDLTYLPGTVRHVPTGDRLFVSGLLIRPLTFDCSAASAPEATVAHRSLIAMAAGQPVHCVLEGTEDVAPAGPEAVGDCYLTDGRGLFRLMAEQGHCNASPHSP